MRRHFRFVHLQDVVYVPGEGCYPKCGRCEMQVNLAATGQQDTKSCKIMHVAILQQKAVSDSAVAMDTQVYAYGEEL